MVAKPDATWGETPLAFVELKSGAEPDAPALIAHCRARLAGFKLPREIRFEPIERTATGKIRKHALRERARVAG